MFVQFSDWLEVNKPNSKSQYSSAYRAINKINEEKHLTPLEDWNLEHWETLYEILVEEEEFKALNTSGHNNLTSGLAQFKNFLESMPAIIIPPAKPFDEFKWRWAVTTPSEGLNRKDILFGVLNVLVKHNGKRHATQEFRNDLIELEDSIPGSRISLSKKEDSTGTPRPLTKNIIENSGQYWKVLGLINTTNDGTISVTELGKSIVNDDLPDEDFVRWQIENFHLPSEIEDASTTSLFEAHNISIEPMKILFQVLSGLTQHIKSPSDWYITADEVKTIIVPLSVDSKIDISVYVEKIIEYRKEPSAFASWPNYTTGANDLRMLKEYLIFLRNFGALTEIDVKSVGLRYYVNEMTINLMEDYNQPMPSSTRKSKQDKVASNTIYFGSPGTGKSNIVDKLTEGYKVRKVTFHPEYDYYNFVGGYKPSMEGKEIVYKFVPQIFTKIYIDAWLNPKEHYFLQIEEINRGNCAEIFGDLFQLLDRDSYGSSKYGVDANEELLVHLSTELGNDHEGISDDKIKLPSNLSIIATMNTSDQSLFPMDSAFKRRWDWEYMKIDYDCKESDFQIVLNNKNKYSWLEFLRAVNRLILDATDSPDKQIGNWFINAKDTKNIINEKTFVNKVLFYLWNDVFKDEEESLFNLGDTTIIYEDFFIKNDNSELIVKIIDEHLKLENHNKSPITEEASEEDSSPD